MSDTTKNIFPILDRRQRPIAQRPLYAALNRLMMNPNCPTAQNEGFSR